MFKDQDLLLKPTVDLYNNVASSGECQGRLSAKLEVHPTLRIVWEFQSLGKNACFPEENEKRRLSQGFIGHKFSLSHASRGGYWIKHDNDGLLQECGLNGAAVEARLGSGHAQTNFLRFYVPNARFLVRALDGSEVVSNYRSVRPVGMSTDLEELTHLNSSVGSFWKCSLGNGWNLNIETSVDEQWFRQEGTFGTFLTAVCTVFQESDMREEHLLNVEEARKFIGHICWLLNFANGGHLGPVVIQMRDGLDGLDLVSVYRTTPIELLGETWVSYANLQEFVSCFTSFEKMVNKEPWDDLYDLILLWYFQAIQPISGQESSKPWPITANALGAALERLSLAIIREYYEEKPRGKLCERIKKTLAIIGINTQEEFDMVEVFTKVRNDATHPKQKRGFSEEEKYFSLRHAIQWVEEILLWRLGYNGAYFRRIPGSKKYSFETPRYDLSTRKSDW